MAGAGNKEYSKALNKLKKKSQKLEKKFFTEILGKVKPDGNIRDLKKYADYLSEWYELDREYEELFKKFDI
jgi:hypothetical protein